MLAGEALNVTVGAAATVTAADLEAEPPGPEQVSVNAPLALNAPVLCVPDSALVPLQDPVAVHDVALVLDHVNCDAAPD
jgi:hypothetical protein